MPTPYLGLSSTTLAAGSAVTFLEWRLLQDNSGSLSNMGKLDESVGSGWIKLSGYEYVTVNYFSVSGSYVMPTGTKLKWHDTSGSIGYGYVLSSASNVTGSATVIGTMPKDGTRPNANTDEIYYSLKATPFGFPDWFTYNSAPFGWSVVPTVGLYMYKMDMNNIYVSIYQIATAGNGISNSQQGYFTLPTAYRSYSTSVGLCKYMDNSTSASVPAYWIGTSNNVLLATNDLTLSNTWTSSGSKTFSGFYSYRSWKSE